MAVKPMPIAAISQDSVQSRRMGQPKSELPWRLHMLRSLVCC
jgi:hypothetical protein